MISMSAWILEIHKQIYYFIVEDMQKKIDKYYPPMTIGQYTARFKYHAWGRFVLRIPKEEREIILSDVIKKIESRKDMIPARTSMEWNAWKIYTDYAKVVISDPIVHELEDRPSYITFDILTFIKQPHHKKSWQITKKESSRE